MIHKLDEPTKEWINKMVSDLHGSFLRVGITIKVTNDSLAAFHKCLQDYGEKVGISLTLNDIKPFTIEDHGYKCTLCQANILISPVGVACNCSQLTHAEINGLHLELPLPWWIQVD